MAGGFVELWETVVEEAFCSCVDRGKLPLFRGSYPLPNVWSNSREKWNNILQQITQYPTSSDPQMPEKQTIK